MIVNMSVIMVYVNLQVRRKNIHVELVKNIAHQSLFLKNHTDILNITGIGKLYQANAN